MRAATDICCCAFVILKASALYVFLNPRCAWSGDVAKASKFMVSRASGIMSTSLAYINSIWTGHLRRTGQKEQETIDTIKYHKT